MEPIVSKSLPVSLNQHRSHGPIFYYLLTVSLKWMNNYIHFTIGVVFASIGSGLGEITFLSMSSHFHRYGQLNCSFPFSK